jgi:serine/threonine-protein kinase
MAVSVSERAMLQTAVTGRYVVEREIGRGGMGIVYAARDLALERTVAIKVLPSELAAQTELRERFLREARTAASLAHPHIVPIHLVEAHDDIVFFVMTYVDGETLTGRVKRTGALPPMEVARILQQVARALGYAHVQGVIHRDIKPDNILIEHGTARAYVTDFGIARRSDRGPLTQDGIVLGTAQFMSPEQAAGELIDGRSDLYALGVVGYFAVTERLPFDGPTVQATLAMHLTQPPPPIATVRPDLPEPLIDAITRALAKDRAERFQSAEELVDVLDALIAPVADIAPLVRNWLRLAEQWLLVVWVLGINGVLLAMIAPQVMGTVVALALATTLAVSVDLYTRTRQLRREGFTHEDVRFASLLERQLRERELQSLFGGAAARAVRGRMVLRASRIAALAMLGIVALTVLKRVVPGVPRIIYTIAGYSAIGAFSLALTVALTGSARMQRSNALYFSAVWRRWLGRWVFRIAGIGLRKPRLASAAGLSMTTLVGDVAKLSPASAREVLGDAADLFSRLAERAAQLAIHELELDRALVDAAESSMVRPLRVIAPSGTSIGNAPVNASPPTLQASALLERRSSSLEQLRSAREETAQERASVQLAGDNLRIQLLRLRAGTGRITELNHDVAAARALLARNERAAETPADSNSP